MALPSDSSSFERLRRRAPKVAGESPEPNMWMRCLSGGAMNPSITNSSSLTVIYFLGSDEPFASIIRET